ncbi:MAG: PEP-CTERM sorting domain-containing protein [Gammaproteobacteria bacterium]|nr:PEP-CTERM sorting domain-containing protein [Gammaproteobacteria bacterium]
MNALNIFKNKVLAVVFICASTFSSNTYALIIINVTDNGGQAEFTFSGSDVISTGGHLNNGFWLNDLNEANAYNGAPNFFGQHGIIGGSADLNINAGSYALQDVWVNGDNADYELGFRSHTNPFDVSVGDTISLSGSILTNLNYSWFNEGSYSFSSVGPYSFNEALLADGIQFNVGAVDVPEPTSLLLLGLGLAGISFAKRKKA